MGRRTPPPRSSSRDRRCIPTILCLSHRKVDACSFLQVRRGRSTIEARRRVAEYVVMTMLVLTHRLFEAVTAFRAGSWVASPTIGGGSLPLVRGSPVADRGRFLLGRADLIVPMLAGAALSVLLDGFIV